MANRIEVVSTIEDTRANVLKSELIKRGFTTLDNLSLSDVYTVDGTFSSQEVQEVAHMLHNPVTQKTAVDTNTAPENFDWAIEIGFLPGVTDNVAHTAQETIEDRLHKKGMVYTSQVMYLSGSLQSDQVQAIAETLANPLIQRITIKQRDQYFQENGMGIYIPEVKLDSQPTADIVSLRKLSLEELTVLGKKGIPNPDGTTRGPLSLGPEYMQVIQDYFIQQGRDPTDVELESLAQTWSEHCKHTIFADPLDDILKGLYKEFIQGATKKIRLSKGEDDFCVSVFKDNSGAIIFDEDYLITDKAETHNSPSALDPFGGSITGIVGVNRDTIGFGLGAKPVINRYGFCFAEPTDTSILYKGENFTEKMLSARQIMDGVIEGVNVGGNTSGIPTPQGFMVFEERYRGKPLVFVGTLGLIPQKTEERINHEKAAQPGDYVVMVGGRVGLDGIHGATFSSEAMDAGSPATAVQIGDPITQKKLSDAIVKEARDLNLYNSITDNGAGGLSCSVAEMAKECGGCYVTLDDVPLKYPGLAPWQTWISESQERMTLSVPKEKWEEFESLMERRGVEATIIGEFTDSGKCVVDYNGETVMDLEMDFLHNGLPSLHRFTKQKKQKHEEPDIPLLDDLTNSLHTMLARPNIASKEFITQQYDHEVQGGSVLKPLQGKGRVNADATATRPLLSSQKTVIISQGINPTYSDIDTYDMAAAAIDTAVRNAIAAGANPNYLALMDNFCWCSSDEPERLKQLVDAVKGAHDVAVEYGTPFISGKDSMFNDFKGYNEKGEPVKISVPPTLLVSSLSVIDDATKTVSLDAKIEGDKVYILGGTHDELGASEFFAMRGELEREKPYIGTLVPEVDTAQNKKTYNALASAIQNELIASAQSVHRGGLAVALAKTAMGGKKGMYISLENLPGSWSREDFALYSESQGRIVVTVAPQNVEAFERVMTGIDFAEIGEITTNKFIVTGEDGVEKVSTSVDNLLSAYRSTFEGY